MPFTYKEDVLSEEQGDWHYTTSQKPMIRYNQSRFPYIISCDMISDFFIASFRQKKFRAARKHALFGLYQKFYFLAILLILMHKNLVYI